MYGLRVIEKPAIKRMSLIAHPPIDFSEQLRRQRVITEALFAVGDRLFVEGRWRVVTCVMALLKAGDGRRLTWERDMALYELDEVLVINEDALTLAMTGKRVATGHLPPTSPEPKIA